MSGSVLVIDDDPDIREALRLILEAYGYGVQTSGDPRQVLAQLEREELPSVILLDMRMPEMSGEEFLAALRAMPLPRPVPVVVLSGDPSARNAARSAGATDFLAKPAEVEELLDTLARHSGPPELATP